MKTETEKLIDEIKLLKEENERVNKDYNHYKDMFYDYACELDNEKDFHRQTKLEVMSLQETLASTHSLMHELESELVKARELLTNVVDFINPTYMVKQTIKDLLKSNPVEQTKKTEDI